MTINKQELKDAILNVFKYQDDPPQPGQVSLFVDKVFKAAGGRRDIYRVQLKKAVMENLEAL